MDFMNQTSLLLLSSCCVALVYFLFNMQQYANLQGNKYNTCILELICFRKETKVIGEKKSECLFKNNQVPLFTTNFLFYGI